MPFLNTASCSDSSSDWLQVTREAVEGELERLTVREMGPGHGLVPSRDVDKNILWLKINHHAR